MASVGHDIKQPTSADRYALEAQQVVLRALDGAGGSWVRHEPKTNIADLLGGSAMDNEGGRR